MIKDIDYYFDPHTWVIPEKLYYLRSGGSGYKNIENTGLKVRADFLDPGANRFWGNYYYEAWGEHLQVYPKSGKPFPVYIETENLLRVIQYCGYGEGGFLKGTYRLIRMSGKVTNVYRLIPEDSRECYFKDEISKIYHNPKIHFTTKMIPGHMYVSKCGDLYICVKGNFKNYSQSSWRLGMLRTPNIKKCLYHVRPATKDLLDKYSPKTFQELVTLLSTKDDFHPSYSYSIGYSGKDLGKLVDPGDILDCFPDITKIPVEYLLADEIWKTDPRVKDELTRRVKEEQKKGSSWSTGTTEFKNLCNELGL